MVSPARASRRPVKRFHQFGIKTAAFEAAFCLHEGVTREDPRERLGMPRPGCTSANGRALPACNGRSSHRAKRTRPRGEAGGKSWEGIAVRRREGRTSGHAGRSYRSRSQAKLPRVRWALRGSSTSPRPGSARLPISDNSTAAASAWATLTTSFWKSVPSRSSWEVA